MNANDFGEIINHEFDFMVTSVAYNAKLRIKSDHFIDKGFGSPEINDLQNVKTAKQITCFASYCDNKNDIRSGLLLFKLKNGFKDNMIKVKVEWDDMNGITQSKIFEKSTRFCFYV